MQIPAYFRPLTLTIALCAAAAPVSAQNPDTEDWLQQCRSDRGRDRVRVCEVREVRLPAGPLSVDGAANGGIAVEGWDRDEVLVQALVSAQQKDEPNARGILEQVRVQTDNRTVRAQGPRSVEQGGWSVSYRVRVPRRADLTLRANNGGISVADVAGLLRMETTNGGLSLRNLGGDVQGETTNGGLDVRLAGSQWQGEGMNLRTTNGGITLRVPEGYSAQLETGTTNGAIHTDIPVTVQGRVNRSLSARLGQGGATIRAVTTNGGIRVRKGG